MDDINDNRRMQPIAHAEELFSSNLTELVFIRKFLRKFYTEHLRPPSDASSIQQRETAINQLELAVDEAASNVMRHAYEGRTDGWIRVVAEAYPDRVALRLLHAGKPFEREKVRPPSFDGSREGGFGVYLIANSVDEVQYENGDQGVNSIYFIKHLENSIQ